MSIAPETAEFERLIESHRGIILKVAATYSRDPHDRADLAQEIALALWHAWPGYERGRPYSTWMYRIALNVAISQQRRASHRRHEPLTDEHAGLVGAEDVDAEAREQIALIRRAMDTLGPLDRALLLLHLEGCSHRDSGEVLGISEGNVATRLNRIRNHLRRIADATTGANDHGNA